MTTPSMALPDAGSARWGCGSTSVKVVPLRDPPLLAMTTARYGSTTAPAISTQRGQPGMKIAPMTQAVRMPMDMRYLRVRPDCSLLRECWALVMLWVGSDTPIR